MIKILRKTVMIKLIVTFVRESSWAVDFLVTLHFLEFNKK